MRRTLIEAAAWRLLAELFRRHAVTHDLRVLETHPCDIYDCRSVFSHDVHILDVNLAGAVHVIDRHRGGPRALFPVAALVDAENLKALVDEVSDALGFRRGMALPADTPAVASIRCVAAMLARRTFGRTTLSTSSASQPHDWLPRVGLVTTGDEATWRHQGRYWRLGPSGDASSGLVFDLSTGRIVDLGSAAVHTIVPARFGRREPTDVLDWIDLRLPL